METLESRAWRERVVEIFEHAVNVITLQKNPAKLQHFYTLCIGRVWYHEHLGKDWNEENRKKLHNVIVTNILRVRGPSESIPWGDCEALKNKKVQEAKDIDRFGRESCKWWWLVESDVEEFVRVIAHKNSKLNLVHGPVCCLTCECNMICEFCNVECKFTEDVQVEEGKTCRNYPNCSTMYQKRMALDAPKKSKKKQKI